MRQHTIQTPYIVGEVHCYSSEIDGELVLFDSGPPTAEAFASLKQQIDLPRLKYLFITHCHIDHFGLASFIRKESDARIFIPRAEDRKIRLRADYLGLFTKLMTDAGCDREKAEYIRKKIEDELALLAGMDYEVVEESDVPARLGIRWMSCPSHSQSDLVYLYDGHAVTGDILLRNIYQVPIYDLDLAAMSGRFHNYDAYCASIRQFARLREYQIHPGHRWHIESIDETILWYVRKVLKRAHLVQHHDSADAVGAIMETLNGASTEPFFLHMKLSESVFTNDFLQNPAQLKASLDSLGLFEPVRAQYVSVLNKAGH